MNPYALTAVAGAVGLMVAALPAKASIRYDASEGENPVDYSDTGADNLKAFLAVLRLGESSDDYRALYGGGRFTSYADHPTFAEGFEGAVVRGQSTHAAGAYQFQPGTWKEAQKALGLPDFSPDSQDKAALFLIKRRGALDVVKAGELARAREMLTKEWASLADRGDEWIASTFESNGGTAA
jgi:muramidase (phage lysozyme)